MDHQMDIPSSPGVPSSAIPLQSDFSMDEPRQAVPDRPTRQAKTTPDGIPKVVDATGEKLREGMQKFFQEYTSSNGSKYYVDQIKSMRVYNNSTLFVDFSHFTGEHAVLGEAIRDQYYRFYPFLNEALQNVIRRVEPSLLQKSSAPTDGASEASYSTTQNESGRIFQVAFYGLPLVSRIRDMHTKLVGHLSCINGTVTRTSEVRPELYSATFKCDACSASVDNVEQHFRYTEPTICPTPNCGNRTSWTLDVTKSTFVDWQKVRIQENPDEIPTGSMPRTLDVILRGDIVERAKAGDKSLFTGSLTVVPDVSQYRIPGIKPMAQRDERGRGEGLNGAVRGLKELGARELSYKMVFMACMVQDEAAQRESALGDEYTQEEFIDSLTEQEFEELQSMSNSPDLYANLVKSVAPTVFGHEMIKKGILLQMMGGVHKTTPEGIQLRGDINVCVVGDPSTSKSQFLKYVCKFVPRAVYTSGKASSAAGLTAAVVKDEETGEFTIEAGALMLADNGICAIDEFDKMDLRDQVAIHEAMEQQTISIAKAGIHATLNARTSILAAANPVGGRYNHRLGLKQNVNMSAPIMSRFDVFFVVLDECDSAADSRLADHIVGLHMDGDEAINPPFSTAQMQRYIQYARTFKPQMTSEAQEQLISYYNKLRMEDVPTAGARSYRITVRQLESLIRLSEAIARAHCDDEVQPSYVEEAYLLLRSSTIRVDYGDVDFEDDNALMNQRTIRRLRNPLSARQRARRERTRITRDAFNSMFNFIISRMGDEDAPSVTLLSLQEAWLSHRIAQSAEAHAAAGDSAEDGSQVRAAVNPENDLDTEEKLLAEKELVVKVLNRMVKQNVLMRILGTSDLDQDDATEESFVLHPNTTLPAPELI